MFEILAHLAVLAALSLALYKVTYPTCTARRCGHNHGAAA